jgi:NAD(P)H-hydrate epimerase
MYYATALEMERLDELAVQNGLDICQMVELAGQHILELFDQLKIDSTSRVVVVCGSGNKAGDGLCAARHLKNRGYDVNVIMAVLLKSQDAHHHLDLVKKMGISPIWYEDDPERSKELLRGADVVIDALVGYHLSGALRGPVEEVAEFINDLGVKVISYDLPSGVDPDTGACEGSCIGAHATLTLALPKKLFETEDGKLASGDVFLGDIGIPASLYDQINPDARPEFTKPLMKI